ncbi:hypothetical protein MTO96_007521 [Rhipicephalus appendiculatus]
MLYFQRRHGGNRRRVAATEVYKTAGPCDPVEDVCPATRPTMHMPGPYRRPCTHQLIFGCFCRKGLYRRESDRKCVPVDQC